MSRLEIAIAGQTLWATGDVKLRVSLDLELRDASGNWHRRTFRVDSGSEITTFPAFDATGYGLPLPRRAASGVSHVQTRLEIRSGILRFRIVGMDLTEYVVPCLFLGDPATPIAYPPATMPHPLLQPLALLGSLRFLMDHDPSSGSLYGHLTVEKK
jgi:hypothetical protein